MAEDKWQHYFLFYVLPDDLEDDGIRRYLDKQTFKYVEVSKELEEKSICAFIERLSKRRANRKREKINIKAPVIDFKEFKSRRER